MRNGALCLQIAPRFVGTMLFSLGEIEGGTEFVELQASKADSDKSWTIKIGDLDQTTLDLSVRNPNAPDEEPLREPVEIIEAMLARDEETAKILEDIRAML